MTTTAATTTMMARRIDADIRDTIELFVSLNARVANKPIGNAQQIAQRIADKYGVSPEQVTSSPLWANIPQMPLTEALATKITFGRHAGKTLAELDEGSVWLLATENMRSQRSWLPAAIVVLGYNTKVSFAKMYGAPDPIAYITSTDPDLWASLGIADL